MAVVKSHCMEIKDLINILKQNVKLILISILLMGITGALAYYFLPPRYYATGSLFVRRSIYPYSEGHFTYEGYYGQQAAMSYTNSVIGLIESDDILSQSLSVLGIQVNQKNLRNYSKRIKTRKTGPQLIELIVKGESFEQAEELWQTMADSTINSLNNISRANDPFVGIIKVSEKPVLKEGFRNLASYTLVGAGFGLVLPLFYLLTLNYFRTGKKK